MSKADKIKRKLCYGCMVIMGLYFLLLYGQRPPSFDEPFSKAVFSVEGELLGAKIATDQQWRFPLKDSIPYKYKACVIEFEDRYFYEHPGVNPVALGKAFIENFSASKPRGASTLTMQLARMTAGNNRRNYFNKISEILTALQLELMLPKEKILQHYAEHAPMGGNVVGLSAASWRYFNRAPKELSWAESALLAVLPNAPSMLHLGKEREALKAKRDRLLDRLKNNGVITGDDCRLAKLERIPSKPVVLPQYAVHAVQSFTGKDNSSIDVSLHVQLQQQLQNLVNRRSQSLKSNNIYNSCAAIIDVQTNQIIAYVGNVTSAYNHENYVDVLSSRRSPGSTLKPLLYAAGLDNGNLLPSSLMEDVPLYYSGYIPKNYYPRFDGMVKADEALSRSLNVPFVKLLQNYGIDPFLRKLKSVGLTTLNKGANHYGLSLILGGGEVNPIELGSAYAGMARTLKQYLEDGTYPKKAYQLASIEKGKTADFGKTTMGPLSAGSIYFTFEALRVLKRPVSMEGWQSFESSRILAWKTGTSFGNKDAWAIGVTPEYVVVTWVGNADGEGRSGLTGVSGAAPLMFDAFELLPSTSWFDPPHGEIRPERISRKSGFIATEHTDEWDSLFVPDNIFNEGLKCPYHKTLRVNGEGTYQINDRCDGFENAVPKKCFVLPPIHAFYYKKRDPFYQGAPPMDPSCEGNEIKDKSLSIMYPTYGMEVYIPTDLNGKKGRVVLEAKSAREDCTIFWHMDQQYLGSTDDFHQLEVLVKPGVHYLTLVDDKGEELVTKFTVLD